MLSEESYGLALLADPHAELLRARRRYRGRAHARVTPEDEVTQPRARALGRSAYLLEQPCELPQVHLRHSRLRRTEHSQGGGLHGAS